MRKRAFIKSAAVACLACAGGSRLGGQTAEPPASATGAAGQSRRREEAFKRDYITTLMEELEKSLDPPARNALINRCGRACARRGSLFKQAEASRGDLKGFVKRMAGVLGEGNARFLDAKTIHWSYPRCFCELVASGPERLPAVYWQCSVGGVQEMFETVLGRPVKVRLVRSIKTGGSSCDFHVDAA